MSDDDPVEERGGVAAAEGLRLTRRGMLQRAGATVSAVALSKAAPLAAAALPPDLSAVPAAGERTAADYPTSAPMTRLSRYISQAREHALPDEVVEKTKWHILDSFAAVVSGSQLPAGRASIRYARAYGGKAVSTVIGDTIVVGPNEAALANGTMGHADETDDFTRGPWHPGVNVVPAALALGEQFHISGTHFLRAVTLGYDVGSRIETAAGVRIEDMVRGRITEPTNSMGGVFGATAAAACVASLDEQQTRWALSYGAQQCSGIDSFRRDIQHIEKGFMNGGMGARSGVTSALLVLAGFDAVNDVFSGPAGFFVQYGTSPKAELIADRLGEYYDVVDTLFKHWPVGGPIQPVVDALHALLKRQRIEASQVREITVRHTPDSITDNAGSADINVQHIVALMLVDGKLTFKSVHDRSRLKDPQIMRLRSRVRELAPIGGVGGGADTGDKVPPVVEVTLVNGTRLGQGPVSAVIGSASNPFTRGWVVEKARSLMAPVLGEASTAQLITRVLELENVKDILQLRPLLQAQGGPPRLSDWPAEAARQS